MGVFTIAIRLRQFSRSAVQSISLRGRGQSLAQRLLDRVRSRAATQPCLVLLERINLAPRQSVALIEADGERLLVATSPEGAPVFYALGAPAHTQKSKSPRKTRMPENER